MKLRRIFLAVIILALLPVTLMEPVEAQPVQVAVGQSSVKMNMNLVLEENLTTLPSINVDLTPSNSSVDLQAIVQAVQKLVPSARIASIELRAKTSNSSAMWRLVENYSLTVTGVSTNLGSSIRSKVDFVAMNVSQSLTVLNQELNAIGSAYLLAYLNTVTPKTTAYYVDGHQTCPVSTDRTCPIATETALTFWLLDFTWVPMVSTWPETRDFLRQTTVWSLDLGSPRFNLTLGTKSPEAGVYIGVRKATYYPTFSVSVPANAWADGNTISFDVGTPFEAVMPVLVIVSLAGLIFTFFWDRRLAGNQRATRKRR